MTDVKLVRDEDEEVEMPIVYFDGSCPLCTFEIGHYERQAGADGMQFVDASKKDAPLGDDLSPMAAMGRFHVRREDGTLVSGAAGFVEIWRVLPRWRWAARIADLPGVTPLLELGYRGFLPLRPAPSNLAARLGASPRNVGNN